eukprot:SAG31_NODE_5797_length_2323_cov_3.180842_2_plen_67_part_00
MLLLATSKAAPAAMLGGGGGDRHVGHERAAFLLRTRFAFLAHKNTVTAAEHNDGGILLLKHVSRTL